MTHVHVPCLAWSKQAFLVVQLTSTVEQLCGTESMGSKAALQICKQLLLLQELDTT